MSYGRKDYFWGVAPEKSVFGELQTVFQQWEKLDIATTANDDFIEYTVSEGYILNITGIILSGSKCGLTLFSIKEGAVSHGAGIFDTTLNIVYGQGGEVVIAPGNIFKINLQNNSAYTISYYVYVYGYLQQTIV